jgi:hypothetical protein
MPLKRILFFILILTIPGKCLLAQTDSLYAQQWNRDPILKLNATTSAQRQIITSEQIRLSGYNRLSDVFQLIDGWTFTTMDGYNWQMQSNGTGNYYNQNWILMVNGQRVGLSRYSAPEVNLLGISVNDIERIEIVNSTGMYLGEFTQKGLIHIVTRKNEEGLSYHGYYGNGISVTDQGRYQVNSDLPSFVNPIGTNNTHALGYSKNAFNATASVNYQKYYVPDSNGSPRLFADTLPHPLNTSINTRVELQYVGRRVLQQLQAGYTSIEETSFGTGKIQTRDFKTIGYLNQWSIDQHHQLRFSATASENGTFYSSSFLMKLFNGNVSYRYLKNYKNGNLIAQAGIMYDKIDRKGFVNNDLIKPYASVNIPLTRKSNLFADGMFTIHDQRRAPKVSAGIYKRVSFISNWSLTGAYAEQLDLEDLSVILRNTSSLVFPYGDERYKSRQLSADFYYNLNIGNNVKFSYNSGIKSIADEAAQGLAHITTPSDPDGYTFAYTSYNASYTNWVNRFNIHYDIIKNLVFDFNYMRTGIVDRSIANIRTVPKHKLSFIIQYDFSKRLALWVRGYRQSETSWFSYGFNPPAVPYYEKLPGFYTMDAGISKKLLKEYLNVNLSVRNIFNSRQQYALIGSQFDTRFTIGISANVDRVFASRGSKP